MALETITAEELVNTPLSVSAGSHVQRGDVIARMAEGALGADIHASICGTVDKAENGMIVIRSST